MRFFIPRTKSSEAETVYLEIKRSLTDQLRLPIQERRIFNLRYTNSKRNWYAEVGQIGQQERQYEVVAIFESNVYIIFNQSEHGGPGPIVLVDKSEVTDIEDFKA
jgi:hypothetical protein